MENKFNQGDPIIWDSRFGYDYGIYDKDEGVIYGTCQVILTSGVAQGPLSRPLHEMIPDTPKNRRLMELRYDIKPRRRFLLAD